MTATLHGIEREGEERGAPLRQRLGGRHPRDQGGEIGFCEGAQDDVYTVILGRRTLLESPAPIRASLRGPLHDALGGLCRVAGARGGACRQAPPSSRDVEPAPIILGRRRSHPMKLVPYRCSPV
jgi:hypothetical protein